MYASNDPTIGMSVKLPTVNVFGNEWTWLDGLNMGLSNFVNSFFTKSYSVGFGADLVVGMGGGFQAGFIYNANTGAFNSFFEAHFAIGAEVGAGLDVTQYNTTSQLSSGYSVEYSGGFGPINYQRGGNLWDLSKTNETVLDAMKHYGPCGVDYTYGTSSVNLTSGIKPYKWTLGFSKKAGYQWIY